MKNNKGFSMVELLAVVAILGILSSIGIVAVTNVLEKAHEEYYKNQEKNLVLAAQSYMSANTSELPKIIGKKEKITAKELKDANYLKKDITRYDGKTKCNDEKTYVNIYKYGDSDYAYAAYLTCPDDKVANETEKEESPFIDAVFPGSKEDVATASIKITLKGEEKNNETKLLSYSYVLYVIENGKSVELVNTGNMAVRQPIVEKTISLSKFTISGNAILKVKATATNIKGNSTSKVFTNDYRDNKPPRCIYLNKEDDPKDPLRRKTWVNRDVKITIGCNDDNGSGCEKERYTKTFTSDGGIDHIKIADNVGNKTTCDIVKYIDKTAPTITVKAYKCNDSSKKSVGTFTANNSNKNITVNSSSLTGNVNGWLNKANYPSGVCFDFTVTDGSSIKTKSWKWNKAGYKKNASGYSDLIGGSSNESFATDDGYHLTTSKKYTHSLSEEGHRYASFVIEDGIGNKNSINLSILIDRTPPSGTVSTKMKKWKNNNTEPKSANGLVEYTSGDWSQQKVYTYPSGTTDSISGVHHYEYTTTGVTTNESNKQATYRNVKKQGVSYIKYRSVDTAGNPGSYNSNATIRLDWTAPSCTPKKTVTYDPDGVNVEFDCYDEHSKGVVCTPNKSNLKTNNKDSKDYSYDIKDKAENTGHCSFTVNRALQYKKRTCGTCSRCSKSSCEVWNYKTVQSCSYKLKFVANGCSGSWVANSNCGTSDNSLNRCCKTCTSSTVKTTCNTYSRSCSKCGCSSWNSWSKWSNSKKTCSHSYNCQTDTRYVYK